MATQSAVSAPIRALLEVFESDLPDILFPDVSAASLAERARTLEETAAALADAEAKLAAAQRAHADAEIALKTAPQRGIGYARVYACDDAALLEKLDAIDLRPRSGRRKLPPKRKPRRRKPTNVAELPLDDSRATG